MARANLEEAEIKCRNMARKLKEMLPNGWGFTIILYSYGDGGFTTYLSTGDREGCIKMLRETADLIEKRKEI